MALSPDRQTLDRQGGHGHRDPGPGGGLPGRDLALPAWRTWPTDHVLDRLGGTPARPRAARTALPPSSTADSPASTPPNRPMGVLAPAQITG